MATWKVSTKEIDGKKVRGIVLPDVDQESLDFKPSAAYGARAITDTDGTVLDVEVPKDRFVPFQEAGGRVATKRLFTVKAHTPAGVLVQIPMEDQINNHTQSPSTGLGLAPYIAKGFLVYWDPQDGSTAFCGTRDCYAEPAAKLGNFCSPAHKEITRPQGDQSLSGFSQGATTSRLWG